MAAQYDIFEPTTTIHPDTIGLYPYTFNGDSHNSSQRLQVMANLAGITILATELLGQDTNRIFDMAARTALKPGHNFAATCLRTSEALQPYLKDYPHRIGIGHSLGGVAVAGMQLEATLDAKPFTAIQLIDAFNLRAPQLPLPGQLSYFWNQARDQLQRTEGIATIVSDNTNMQPEPGRPESSFVTRFHSLSKLMRSTESRQRATDLALKTDLPLHVIGLTHGIAGPADITNQFLKDLVKHRQNLAEHHPETPAAALRTDLLDGWHSQLIDPFWAASWLKPIIDLAVADHSSAI